MIEVKGVGLRFGERTVLHDIDLTLSERRIGIVGANGSGKSSLARLLNGLQRPTSGEVRVDGLDTRTQGGAVRRKVGFVFQNPDHQIVYPTVEEDLAFGLKNLKRGKAEIAAAVDAILARFDLSAVRHHSAHLLSGGQKQMLAIAAVLVMEPLYVVFDEPTTLLDLRNSRRIGRVIRSLAQTAIIVSHDLDLLADVDRVLVIDEGRIAVDDEPARALPRYVEMMSGDLG